MGTVRAYKFYPARWGLEALYRRRLKLSTSSDINDPFEFLATGANKASRIEALRVRNKIFAENGLISFSATWIQPLLWSHYADNHRGIALGFDLDERNAYRVSYTAERVKFPDSNPDVYRFGKELEFWDAIATTKYKAWEYEEELRIQASLAGSIVENELYFRPIEHIGRLREVILGADYRSAGNKELENRLVAEGVHIISARLSFRDFTVVPQNANRLMKAL